MIYNVQTCIYYWKQPYDCQILIFTPYLADKLDVSSSKATYFWYFWF